MRLEAERREPQGGEERKGGLFLSRSAEYEQRVKQASRSHASSNPRPHPPVHRGEGFDAEGRRKEDSSCQALAGPLRSPIRGPSRQAVLYASSSEAGGGKKRVGAVGACPPEGTENISGQEKGSQRAPPSAASLESAAPLYARRCHQGRGLEPPQGHTSSDGGKAEGGGGEKVRIRLPSPT